MRNKPTCSTRGVLLATGGKNPRPRSLCGHILICTDGKCGFDGKCVHQKFDAQGERNGTD